MNYWQKRLFDATNALYEKDAMLADAQLNREYQAVAKRIIREMRLLYNEIKDTTDWEQAGASALYSYNRYYSMINELNNEMLKLGSKEITTIEPRLKNLYTKTSAMVNDSFGLGGSISPQLAQDAIDFIWCPDKLTLSDRVWKSTDKLKERLLSNLIDCLATGRKQGDFVNELTKTFGVSYSEASRLVRTEMSYIQNKASIDRYTEAGIEYYEVVPATDERTCKECKALQGRQFRLEDADVGTNFPPIHPNDRCCVVPVLASQIKMKTKYRGQGQTPKGVSNTSEE